MKNFDIVASCVVLGSDMRELIQHIKDDVGRSQIIGKVMNQSLIGKGGGYVLTLWEYVLFLVLI